MVIRKVTSSLVLSLTAAIMVGSLASSCSNEEFEVPRKTLATRSGNNLVEHIVEGGYKTTEMEGGDSVSFYVKAAWTPGWFNYLPFATINAKASDVTLRIFKYKKNVELHNYTESHEPPYYKVSPSTAWANSILVYSLDMNYEVVVCDTINGIEVIDTIKGKCQKVYENIPDECLSPSTI